ncbi:MAG: glycosyltransferase [Bacteroidetes bacterium]|nr:glycosyltransferase [Bacteroidota bacterium]
MNSIKQLPYFDIIIIWGPILLISILIIIQLYYLLLVFTKLLGYRPTDAKVFLPVSIIICAKNELQNLKSFLPYFLKQDYPDYQVIVVNDGSWDGTGEYLQSIEAQFSNLKIVTIKEQEKYKTGKKFALTLGIKGASHEHLIFTDADCEPSGNTWLQNLMRNYQSHSQLIIGYAPYKNEGGFLNSIIRFDTAHNAILYLSRAIAGKAFMGVGRNLGYTKTIFFENKGFASHQHLLSGDDDLFVNQAATHNNTSVAINEESFTYSVPKKTWASWIQQKTRHVSVARHYKARDQRLISIYHVTQALILLMAPILIVLKLQPLVIACCLAGYLLLRWSIITASLYKLKEQNLAWMLPLFDVIFIFISPIIYIRSRFYKNTRW